MRRILLVKTSSMGDVIHALAAVTDARRALPDIEFDWVVEEGFAEIPALHPAVDEVIPFALRRWRGSPIAAARSGEIPAFRRRLRAREYDLVLDAQGLLKSALICRFAGGDSAGFDHRSAREPLAAWFYARRLTVPRGVHAVERLRQMFALALGYAPPAAAPDYGIRSSLPSLPEELAAMVPGKFVVFLHGSSWESKAWPLEYWERLARRLTGEGMGVLLPWSNEFELQDANLIAVGKERARVLPRLGLHQLAALIGRAAGVVCGDTGLGHLAVAFGVPSVALYGPTSPVLTGLHGERAENLASDHLSCIPCMQRECRLLERGEAATGFPPCFAPLDAERVADALTELMGRAP